MRTNVKLDLSECLHQPRQEKRHSNVVLNYLKKKNFVFLNK